MEVRHQFSSPMEEEKTWKHLIRLMVDDATKQEYFTQEGQFQKPGIFKKCGRLVVVGSGIKCAGHFTSEALSHIKNADKVLFCVSDPVTEAYIRDLIPGALNLAVFFDTAKDRYDSCVQMAEACLFFTRQGLYTVAIFDGHPGLFSLPAMRAMQIAKKQDLMADLLPGISYEDTLFSDLAIDPYSHGGFQTLGATDFLLFNRQLLPDSHVLIRHVGSIGEQGFCSKSVAIPNLITLINQLQKVYGPDYQVVHYYPSQYPTCKPFIDRRPLTDFLKPDIQKQFNVYSSLYIPPTKVVPINSDMAVQLGLVSNPSFVQQLQVPNTFDVCSPRDKQIIESLPQWKFPSTYSPVFRSGASHFLTDICTKPKKLLKYMKNPTKLMMKYGLRSSDIASLMSNVPRDIQVLVTPHNVSIPCTVARRLCMDPTFASAYNAVGNRYRSNLDGEEKVIRWLQLQGYVTTPEAVDSAMTDIRRRCFATWVGNYITNIPDVIITIGGGKVFISGVPLKNFLFKDGALTWSQGDGVNYSGILRFDETPINTIVGKLWKSNEGEPSIDNIRGDFSLGQEETWKDLEWIIGMGVATNMHMKALIKTWRHYLQGSAPTTLSIQSQQKQFVLVREEVDKTGRHLGLIETLLLKLNPNFKSIVLNDKEFTSMGWPASYTIPLSENVTEFSKFPLTHVPVIMVPV